VAVSNWRQLPPTAAVQAIAAQQTADAKNRAQQLAASTATDLVSLFQQVLQPVATVSQVRAAAGPLR
jgi:hypothetical protein